MSFENKLGNHDFESCPLVHGGLKPVSKNGGPQIPHNNAGNSKWFLNK